MGPVFCIPVPISHKVLYLSVQSSEFDIFRYFVERIPPSSMQFLCNSAYIENNLVTLL